MSWYLQVLKKYTDFNGRARRKEYVRVDVLTRLSIFYELLLGWLPGGVQQKIANRLYFSPEDASRKNALVELLFGFYTYHVCFSQNNYQFFYVSMFLLADGLLRWVHVSCSDRPLGLFPVEIVGRIYNGICGLFSSGAKG